MVATETHRLGRTRLTRPLACATALFAALTLNAAAARANVVLNEINCEGTDWIELVNTSATDADISGWRVTDDPIDGAGADPYYFPSGTMVLAGDELVVNRLVNGVGEFPFGISCDDTIRLADATPTVLDEETFGQHVAIEDTWGRYPSGGDEESWTETVATKGTANLPSSATGGGDLAAWLFDPSAVVEIDLGIPQASREALAVDPLEYVDGTFSLKAAGVIYGPLDVGVRLKGGVGSFRPLGEKAAFKVKFNHSAPQTFFGLKKLTLNNMVQDDSEIHEVLAYEAFRAMGIAAPRTGYAYVRVDGEDYGLYLNLETWDDVSLPRWFDSTQHLYEGEYGADVVPGGAGALEVDEGSESDRSDLEALIAAAADTSGDFSEQMEGIADLEEMTRMWAVERYIGHWDGYSGRHSFSPNNYYLHSDATGLFEMLPWGTDQTFVHAVGFDHRGPRLFDRCLDDESCREMYFEAVQEIPAALAPLDLDALAQSTAASLAPWQALDPKRLVTTAEIATKVAETREFIRTRPEHIDHPAYWANIDRWAPETSIIGPRPVVRTRKRRALARFELTSSDPEGSFQCSLDGRPWHACPSEPWRRVRRGVHALRARSIDAAGNVDPSPAKHVWRVSRARR